MATKIEPEIISNIAKKVGTNSRSAPSTFLKCVQAIASLKLTAVLLAMSVFIVLVGTLVQVEKGIWDVIDNYFRINFNQNALFVSEFPFVNPKAIFAHIEFKYFFPPSYFPIDPNAPTAFPHNIGGGFYFPKGWLIGLFLSVNLLAAHGLKFKIQAKGMRFYLGLGVIALGILVTSLVILSGFDKDGVQDTPWMNWDTMWLVFKFGTVLATVAAFTGFVSLWMKHSEQKPEFWILGTVTGILSAVSLYLLIGGDAVRLNKESMRILWQLLKGTFAGVVLLAGCWLLFKKRAGIVLLHTGVGLMMFSELLVGVNAEEANMTILEGSTVNYVEDSRSLELAIVDVTDPSENREVIVPERMITEKSFFIEDDALPFDLETVRFYKNSNIRNLDFKSNEQSEATKGFGLIYTVDETKPIPATDSRRMNFPTVFMRLIDKSNQTDKKNKVLGVYMFPLMLTLRDRPEVVEHRGKKYELSLRYKRTYKPYSLTLYDFTAEYYEGTRTPKHFGSVFRMVDPEKGHDGEHHISMNNPLRYGGETFYQSSFNIDEQAGTESTIIQVVVNTGWVIPYVACMLVATGLLAHFLIVLTRFFNRRQMEFRLNPLAESDSSNWNWGLPMIALAVGGLYMVVFPMILSINEVDGFDVKAFGEIPVFDEGRTKPLDSLAREQLRILSENKQTFNNRKNERQPAVQLLLDLIAKPETADTHRIFRVDNPELWNILDLEKRKGLLYSYSEISAKDGTLLSEVEKMAQQAQGRNDVNQFTPAERKASQLVRSVYQYRRLTRALENPVLQPDLFDLQVAELYPLVTNLLEDQPAQIIPIEKSKSNWENLFQANLKSELRKIAISQNVNTIDELVRLRGSNLEDTMVHRAISRVLMVDTSNIPSRSGTPTAAEIETFMMRQLRNRVYLSVFPHILRPVPSRDKKVIASRLPDDLRQKLYDAEVQGFVALATKSFSPAAMNKLRETISSIDEKSTDPTERHYSTVLEHILEVIFNGETLSEEDHKSTELFRKIVDAYRDNEPADFNSAIEEYRDYLSVDNASKLSQSKLGMELFLNRKSPFFVNMLVYFTAAILAFLGLFVATHKLQKFSFWMMIAAFVYHSIALYLRMDISGRPPVTNLYSSAIFSGWGCVLLGLILEVVFRIGFGNLVAALAGGFTLLIAYKLPVTPSDADSLKVMQAVLDTTFWLATHVICIALGYSATALAGVIGVVFIVSGIFTPLLNEKIEKSLGRIVYGTLCFAIFFSFIGTVLGGLWADDSWGRFWGWDPKENGALMIVLWNALILHLHWDKSIQARGLAILTTAGLIVLAWSWFGVNQLGAGGLHEYGAQEATKSALKIFGVTMTVFVLISCMPKSVWWSYVAREQVNLKSSDNKRNRNRS